MPVEAIRPTGDKGQSKFTLTPLGSYSAIVRASWTSWALFLLPISQPSTWREYSSITTAR